MKKAILAKVIENLVEEIFKQSLEDYIKEINTINAHLRYGSQSDYKFVDDVRPKFITGDPCKVEPHAYVAIFSLNHKYFPPEEEPRAVQDYSRLNASSESHLDACLNYFDGNHPIYTFFNQFTPILKSFIKNLGRPVPSNSKELLNSSALFLDHLPFFSKKSQQIKSKLDSQNIQLNNQLHRKILELCPPRAILLNGKNTHNLHGLQTNLRQLTDFKSKVLNAQTSIGNCVINVATYQTRNGDTVKVVRTNFIRSVYGPNSDAQLEEVGEVLAE